MNQEPFKPKPIVKNQLEKSSNAGQVIPLSVPPPAIEADPVTRFANELLAVRNELNFLGERIKELYVREEPATVSQVDAILEAAKKGINFNMNAQAVAQQLVPELEKTTQKAVTRIEETTQKATSQMNHVYERQSKKWNATIGFTSGRSAITVMSTVLCIVGASIWYAATQYERISGVQAELAKTKADKQFWKEYAAWVDTRAPKLWEVYKAKINKENTATSK